ncbi:ABC transporter G family member 22 isoform X2 [Jatropha curcas]|uniref:ABC transporter G family member 22 isoform X2 n=1 Tax=Jatropha curcas TaxID=180498 RepID=UPI0009D7814B|nr:ABC transporter G family member 22 isoform X2 [Jatropha curcas]
MEEVNKELGYGCKSSSTVNPEDNNNGESGKTEQKMQNLEMETDNSPKGNLMCKTKSFSASFLINIDDLVDNVSTTGSFDKTGNAAMGQSPSDHQEDPDSCKLKKMQVEPTLPIALKFQEVKYKVYSDKYVLHGISGSAHPGEVLALMGPSGGGKTSLLNLLSGRVKFTSGSIAYNGRPYTKSLKRRIGFVTQDDVLFPHLTVKETLTYAALLRLPNILTREQKKERAMKVITELGLERSQNSVIGGKFVRGISGGERKRVCIGHEILLNPSLLFLDEPTSGLDSTTALRIVQILQNMAKTGKTIVTTIHQPSSRLFGKFDRLILLGKGSSLYFGKASEAMSYFSSIGCHPVIAMNPAEFLIDLANGNINDKPFPSELEEKFLLESGSLERKKEGRSYTDIHEYLLKAYEKNVESSIKKTKSVQAITIDREMEFPGKMNPREWEATWGEQFSVLVSRSFKERRHQYFSFMRITQVVATAIIIGLLWWHSGSSLQQAEDQAGLLFFISVFWGFFPLFTAIFTFPQEKVMLAKERAVGMYRLSAYFAARNISDLPLDLILPTIFLVTVYFMVGLKLSFAAFSLTMLTVFLSIVAAQGLGLTIGAAFMDIKKATTLASITIMTFMLSGGFFLQEVPSFMSWVRYISFNYHTYRLLLRIQYPCSSDSDSEPSYCQSPFITNLRLDRGAKEVVAMMVMIVAYRLLAYVFLRKMKLSKMA